MKSTAVRIALPPTTPATPTLRERATEMARRERETSNESIWQASAEMAVAPPMVAPPIPIEGEMLAILVRPLAASDSALIGHARKERELVSLLDRLTAIESHFLHKRLAAPRSDDRLAIAFGRLMIERRSRLLAYLRDARRRAAFATAARR
jgi:hypothetical protein